MGQKLTITREIAKVQARVGDSSSSSFGDHACGCGRRGEELVDKMAPDSKDVADHWKLRRLKNSDPQ